MAKERNLSVKPENFIQNLILLAFLTAVSSATFLILFDISFSGKIYPRVSAADGNIGYMDSKSAQQLVENKVDLWKNRKIEIDYRDAANPGAAKKWQIEIAETGVTPSASKTVLAAYNAGRAENLLKNIAEKIKIITRGENFPLYYDLDENKFNSYLATKFSFLERPSQNASLTLAEGKLVEISAQNGYTIDRTDFKNRIVADVQSLDNGSVSIKVVFSTPEITDENIREADNRTKSLLESKISLRFEDKSWPVDGDLLRSALQFEPEAGPGNDNNVLALKINNDPIINFLEKIQLEINREATNAVFGIADGKITAESGGKTGIALSLDLSTQKIIEEMLKGAESGKKNIDIELIAEETQPDIGLKALEKMGITALLGQGESNFSGSTKNRRQNIAVGAAKFNNIFIADGEEFSFVKTLGEISEKTGYLPELVIKDKSVIPELGGGLCQVATTAFRAAIYSGLPILERRPHAYPVPYYNPQGLDATIYPPHPDLKFKNDTGGAILIQTKIVKNELFFNFFGIAQNRTIKVVGPNVYDKQPDGSMKAVFWREFYEGDKLLKKESFYSSYSSPANYPHKNPLE